MANLYLIGHHLGKDYQTKPWPGGLLLVTVFDAFGDGWTQNWPFQLAEVQRQDPQLLRMIVESLVETLYFEEKQQLWQISE